MRKNNSFTKSKGYKGTLKEMKVNETVLFPRTSFGTIRNTLSILKVEYPERGYNYEVVENGIEVVCVK